MILFSWNENPAQKKNIVHKNEFLSTCFLVLWVKIKRNVERGFLSFSKGLNRRDYNEYRYFLKIVFFSFSFDTYDWGFRASLSLLASHSPRSDFQSKMFSPDEKTLPRWSLYRTDHYKGLRSKFHEKCTLKKSLTFSFHYLLNFIFNTLQYIFLISSCQYKIVNDKNKNLRFKNTKSFLEISTVKINFLFRN